MTIENNVLSEALFLNAVKFRKRGDEYVLKPCFIYMKLCLTKHLQKTYTDDEKR